MRSPLPVISPARPRGTSPASRASRSIENAPLVGLIVLNIARQSTRHRPRAASHSAAQKRSVRHQAGATPVAVAEGVHPQQSVVRRSNGNDPAQARELLHFVGFATPFQKAQQCIGAGVMYSLLVGSAGKSSRRSISRCSSMWANASSCKARFSGSSE